MDSLGIHEQIEHIPEGNGSRSTSDKFPSLHPINEDSSGIFHRTAQRTITVHLPLFLHIPNQNKETGLLEQMLILGVYP